jgi:hypothetical protein
MSVDRTHLLIPIHVDALVVGKDDRKSDIPLLKNGTVNAAPDYSKLKGFYRTGPELRRPREQMKPALAPGVHLHFRLPAATAHGHLDRKPAFPRIPNRWLVQRYYTEGSALELKTWLVLSDQEAQGTEEIKSAVMLLVSPPPAGTAGDFYCRPTGVAKVIWDAKKVAGHYDLSLDNKRAEVELTAVSGGDPGFSAHYPACRSILGLYDDLAGVKADPNLSLCYLVTGWYSAIEDDPWNQFVATLSTVDQKERPERVNQWMQEHGCVKNFEKQKLPEGILCHGCVTHVRRDTNGSAPKGADDPFREFENLRNYWVDLGNTSAEAFAARVADKRATQDPADRNLLEDLVTALQVGLFSQGSDAAQMDAELHRQGFVAVGGGKAWVIQQAQPAPADTTPAVLPALPADLQEHLDKLNGLQARCERHERLFQDYQWELYALWHRWTSAIQKNDNALKPNLDILQHFVDLYKDEVNGIRKTRDDAQQQLGQKLVQRSSDAVVYSLAEQPVDPFYAPKDPVLMLTGPAAEARGTHQRPKTVTVRITNEELQSFHYDPAQTLTADDQWLKAQGVSREYLQSIPPWSARLFREALLLDQMETGSYPGAEKKLAARPDRPDAFSRFSWPHNPWIPLYLWWETSWTPDIAGDQIATDAVTKHWTLNFAGNEPKKPSLYRRNGELILTGSPAKQTPSVECSGLSFIGQPLFNLQYERAEAKSDLKRLMDQIEEKLGSRPALMVSQPLGGLHDALMMRRAGDQLPPLSYSLWKGNKLHPLHLDPIHKSLGSDFHPDSSPVTVANAALFCPLRTGLLQLKDLWIIDAFGQRIQVWPAKSTDQAPGLCESGRLNAGPPTSGFPASVRLHPRLCRPMRLLFKPSATDPEPICGWVVLNRFDQNLVLYKADGRPAGILQRRFADAGKTQFYWVPVPGASESDALPNGIENPYLRDFANFVLALNYAGGKKFAELLSQAVEATEQRVPEDNPLLSVLVGRPLALVRAELRLEPEGLPALDQKLSWTANDPTGAPPLAQILATSLGSASAPPPNQSMVTGGVENVRWPVRLGDRRSTNDGLVGFFKGEPPLLREVSNLDVCPFHASWGFDFDNVSNPGLQAAQELELDCVVPHRVTLLMDPQARVHVTSGFLPKGALELSAAQLEGAKRVREVFFQAAPVLGTPTTAYVPKPSDDYGQWSWTYRPNVTGWAEDPDMVSAAELAGPAVGWPTLTEGWLKLKIETVVIRSLWMKAPEQKPKKATNVTLAWSLHGADSVAVFRLRPDGSEEDTPEKKWNAAPLVDEFTTLVTESTRFRVRASNRAGDEQYKDIAVEIEE